MIASPQTDSTPTPIPHRRTPSRPIAPLPLPTLPSPPLVAKKEEREKGNKTVDETAK